MATDAYQQQAEQGQARMVERFVRLITPAPRVRKDKNGEPIEPRVTENAEYVAMIQRMIRALEARACGDAEILPMIVELQKQLGEVVDVAIATNAARFQINPHSAPSAAECGRALGIKKQSASERAKRGRLIIAQRLAAANAIPFSEARREREARERAAEIAVTALADYRGRHLAAVKSA